MNRQTLADTIVYALTEDIVAKRLMPGAELDEGRLGERFAASRTPVREALRQLAASGLVTLRPHRAPLVAQVDDRGVAEMFDVMAEIEALCAARAARAMEPERRREFQELHRAMGEAMRAGDVQRYRAGNLAFHGLIYEGSGNRYLRDLAVSTRGRLAPYRGAQLEAPARLAMSWAEHDAIVNAILRANGPLAAELMRAHLSETQSTVRDLESLGLGKAGGDHAAG